MTRAATLPAPQSPPSTVREERRQHAHSRWPLVTVVDVGARGGLHRRWARCVAPVMGIGFDADPKECERLSGLDPRSRFYPYALGAVDGATATLHITASPGSSSLLAPNTDFISSYCYAPAMKVLRTMRVNVTTLDTVCARERLRPDALKLDVQGAELDVLRGGGSVLPTTLVVEAEVEFNEVYARQPLFGDLDRYLRDRGWLLLGLRRALWRRRAAAAPVSAGGTLMHGDALWVNAARLADADRVTRLRAIAILSAYKQADYVAQLAKEIGLPTPVETLLPRPPLWARVAGAAMRHVASHARWRAWLDQCRPAGATDWHDSEEFY